MRIILERRTYPDRIELVEINPLSADQKTVAERKWQSRKLAPAPQQPCDEGLFDPATGAQSDLIDWLQRKSNRA